MLSSSGQWVSFEEWESFEECIIHNAKFRDAKTASLKVPALYDYFILSRNSSSEMIGMPSF